jgi:hypothetical protein
MKRVSDTTISSNTKNKNKKSKKKKRKKKKKKKKAKSRCNNKTSVSFLANKNDKKNSVKFIFFHFPLFS